MNRDGLVSHVVINSAVLENKSKCDMFTYSEKDNKQKIIRKAYFDPPVNMYLSVC